MKQLISIVFTILAFSVAMTAQVKQPIGQISAKYDTTLTKQLQVLKQVNKDLTQEIKYRRDEETSMRNYIDQLDSDLASCEDELWYCRYQVDSVLHAIGLQLNDIETKLKTQTPSNRTVAIGLSYGSKYDNAIASAQFYFNRVIFKGEYIFKSSDSFRLGLGMQVTNRLDIVGLVTFNTTMKNGYGTEIQYEIIPKVIGVVGTDTSRGVIFGCNYVF